MADMDDDELLDALGVEVAPLKVSSHTPREERIIAGFEDILHFYHANGRAPQHGEGRDIFERLYAVRLDQIRKLPEAQSLLATLDSPGLLSGTIRDQVDVDSLDEDALLAELGVDTKSAGQSDITVLRQTAGPEYPVRPVGFALPVTCVADPGARHTGARKYHGPRHAAERDRGSDESAGCPRSPR